MKTNSGIEGLYAFAAFAAFLWLLLFPALAWGKSAIPWPEIRRLLGRAAKLSVGVGVPATFILFLLFERMDPHRLPLRDSLPRCAAVSIGFLPLYGALIATSVFQARHRADRAAGAARPLAVRLVAGLLILVANGFACLILFFTLFAITGVYRGWR